MRDKFYRLENIFWNRGRYLCAAFLALVLFITTAVPTTMNMTHSEAKVKVNKPGYLKVYRAQTSALLEWEKVSGVTGYKIYRKELDGKYKYLGKVKQSTYKKVQTDYIQFVDWTHEKDDDYGEKNKYSYKKNYRYKVVAYKTVKGKQYNAKKITKTSKKHKKQKVEFGYEMLPLVNELRKENGKKIAVWSHSLEDGTVIRAKEIADEYNHTRPNGSYYNTAFDYIKTMGVPSNIFTGGVMGENINRGYTVDISWETSFYAWCNSGGHWSQFMYNMKDDSGGDALLVDTDDNDVTYAINLKDGDIIRSTMGICTAQYQKTKGGSRCYVYEVGRVNTIYSVYDKPYEGFKGSVIRNGQYIFGGPAYYDPATDTYINY